MHPQLEQEVKFFRAGEIWSVGTVNLAVVACVLRRRLKKGRHLIRGESAPGRENPGYAYASFQW